MTQPPPETREEFQTDTAPALKDAGHVALTESHTPWIFTETFYARHNLQVADMANGNDGATTELMIDQSEIKAHFEAFKSWIDDGYAAYCGAGRDDDAKPFNDGETAIWPGSSGSFGGLAQTADFEFAAVELPYWEAVTTEPRLTFIGGAALFAMLGHPEENKATAEFAVS